MKLAFVCSEAVPFVKSGGLADASSALASALARDGHDVRLILPLYRQSTPADRPVRALGAATSMTLRFGPREYRVSVLETSLADGGVPVYLLACPELFERERIYTQDEDEPIRFAALARGALELCQRLGWAPDVLHAHDWHAGLLPLYQKTLYAWDRLFASTRALLTIHNIGYQGVFDAAYAGPLGFSGQEHLFEHGDLEAGRLNFLKTGILYADRLSTVSPTYAREITQGPLGMGLEGFLSARRDRLTGILNGIDDTVWNPAIDPHLACRYSIRNLAAKGKCKKALLAVAGLPYDPKVPTFGWISRLTAQKGVERAMEVLPAWIPRNDCRWVVLGSGEPHFEAFWHELERAFPARVSFYRGYDEPLAHRIEAGADVFVMPSRYEPCGLNQMYSQAYGTVPIVRRTGGLADSVELYDPETDRGTGIVFDHDDALGLRWALDQAVRLYPDRKVWNGLRRRGMERDFSWRARTGDYLKMYRALVAETSPAEV